MKILFFVLFGILLFSCSNENRVENDDLSEIKANNDSVSVVKTNISKFSFKDFKIEKSKIGPIRIGMKIKDAENFISDLKKIEVEGWDFGFDGGGKAFMYNQGNIPILALIPAYDSDSIIAIIALSEKLNSSSGIKVGTSVKDLLEIYPKSIVEYNSMSEWEQFQDTLNNWDFIYGTTSKNTVGKYDFDNEILSSKPVNLNFKLDWITIR